MYYIHINIYYIYVLMYTYVLHRASTIYTYTSLSSVWPQVPIILYYQSQTQIYELECISDTASLPPKPRLRFRPHIVVPRILHDCFLQSVWQRLTGWHPAAATYTNYTTNPFVELFLIHQLQYSFFILFPDQEMSRASSVYSISSSPISPISPKNSIQSYKWKG